MVTLDTCYYGGGSHTRGATNTSGAHLSGVPANVCESASWSRTALSHSGNHTPTQAAEWRRAFGTAQLA